MSIARAGAGAKRCGSPRVSKGAFYLNKLGRYYNEKRKNDSGNGEFEIETAGDVDRRGFRRDRKVDRDRRRGICRETGPETGDEGAGCGLRYGKPRAAGGPRPGRQ